VGLKEEPVLKQVEADPPAALPGFGLELVRTEVVPTSAPLGLVLDPSSKRALYVCKLADGEQHAAAVANSKAPEGGRVQPGDFVIAESAALAAENMPPVETMLTDLSQCQQVKLRVMRPYEFTITVDKSGGSLGCDIKYDNHIGTSLVIDGMKEGAVMEWNKANPSRAVQAGDHLIAVSGAGGSAVALLGKIKDANTTVDLSFARCTWV